MPAGSFNQFCALFVRLGGYRCFGENDAHAGTETITLRDAGKCHPAAFSILASPFVPPYRPATLAVDLFDGDSCPMKYIVQSSAPNHAKCPGPATVRPASYFAQARLWQARNGGNTVE